MTDAADSKSETARRFYEATAVAAADFSLMNYGYALPGAIAAAESEGYCLALYRYLLNDAKLRGLRVLEVSCGRGGGAADIAAAFQPGEYIGLDISARNIQIAVGRFAHLKALRFQVGRAEDLPLAPSTCDVVINIEASHLYDDPARFFCEVARVLVPGGLFFYADLGWRDSDPASLLRSAGLLISHEEDITEGVLRALDLDSERRERIVKDHIPESLQDDYRNWSGVRGYRAYNRFASREWVYRALRAQRPS
ncbi:MAG: class I SAM-dependent methyltransferase [Gammaproteobacteria bacterium]